MLQMQNLVAWVKALRQDYGDSIVGILSAAIVLGLWGSSLIWLFRIDIHTLPLWAIGVLFFARMFLHTGLFITAHDAMHGCIAPGHPRLNRAIGWLAIAAYALLPYDILAEKHHIHHAHPATDRDPDFCPQHQENAVRWYVSFMVNYMKYKHSWLQLVAITAIFHGFKWVLQIPDRNVLFFWGLPMVFSSFQMFYFGVFLPHREPAEGYRDRHHAQSSYYSKLWSFITCYHFGYHWEHHEFPHLPWYKLPSAVQLKKSSIMSS